MAQVYIPEKKSAIDKIMQGLQVAQSVYGIKSAYDQNKLNELKMKEAEQAKEERDRISKNEFTKGEAAQNLFLVEPGTSGASTGYIIEPELTAAGKPLYDPDTGESKTKKTPISFYTKGSAQIQEALGKNQKQPRRI